MPFKIEFSTHFTTKFDGLSESERGLIEDFIFHYTSRGLGSFIGKCVPSDNVPDGDPERASKVRYAHRHRLYHVHIGHPFWVASQNPLSYKTSDYMVHFQKFSPCYIALVDYGNHNPFELPDRKKLFRY